MTMPRVVAVVVAALLVGSCAALQSTTSTPVLAYSTSSVFEEVVTAGDLRSILDVADLPKHTILVTHDSLRANDFARLSASSLAGVKASFDASVSSAFVSAPYRHETLRYILSQRYTDMNLPVSHLTAGQFVDGTSTEGFTSVHVSGSDDLAKLDAVLKTRSDAGEVAVIFCIQGDVTEQHQRVARDADDGQDSATVNDNTQRAKGVTPPEKPNYVALNYYRRHAEVRQFFTVPILMGVIVGLLIVVMSLVGIYGLFTTETPQRWPDPAHDKNLNVPN